MPDMAVIPTPPAVPVVPDVWAAPATGLPWCDCGADDPHPLTRDFVEECVFAVIGNVQDRITHPQVVKVAATVWHYAEVCRFFTMQVAAAATEVADSVQDDYPLETGMAIVKVFSDAWNGCPEEACDG